MRGSLKIAQPFGIPIFVHWSFLLLFLLVVYAGRKGDSTPQDLILLSSFIIMAFVCVILHELGHALSARYYGVKTKDIIILPIGGVARLDKLPEKPFQEFVVAVAGPLVNVAIFALLGVFLSVFFSFTFNFSGFELVGENDEIFLSDTSKFLFALMQWNMALVVFNMIPAFPMDGGRVFRSLLSIRIGRLRATRFAYILGQIMAVCFVVYAISPLVQSLMMRVFPDFTGFEFIDWSFNPILLFIAFFVFNAARNEYEHVKNEAEWEKHTARDLVRTHFTTFKILDSVQQAAWEMKKGYENDFLVVEDEKILRGVLRGDDIITAMRNRDYEAVVLTYLTRDFVQVQINENLKQVYNKMMTHGQNIVPVFDGENLVGVVDERAIHNFFGFENKIK